MFALSAITRERALRAWLIPLSQLAATVVLMSQTRAIFGGRLHPRPAVHDPARAGRRRSRSGSRSCLSTVPSSARRRAPPTGWSTAARPRSSRSPPSSRSASGARRPSRSSTSPRTATEALLRRRSSARSTSTRLRCRWSTRRSPTTSSAASRAGTRPCCSMYDDVEIPSVVQDDFYVLDETGALVHPELDVARRARRRPATADCDGHLVGPAGAGITLDGPVFGAVWRLRIDYTATTETPAVITLGDREVPVTLLAGEHTLETSGAGQYDAVRDRRARRRRERVRQLAGGRDDARRPEPDQARPTQAHDGDQAPDLASTRPPTTARSGGPSDIAVAPTMKASPASSAQPWKHPAQDRRDHDRGTGRDHAPPAGEQPPGPRTRPRGRAVPVVRSPARAAPRAADAAAYDVGPAAPRRPAAPGPPRSRRGRAPRRRSGRAGS